MIGGLLSTVVSWPWGLILRAGAIIVPAAAAGILWLRLDAAQARAAGAEQAAATATEAATANARAARDLAAELDRLEDVLAARERALAEADARSANLRRRIGDAKGTPRDGSIPDVVLDYLDGLRRRADGR